MHAWGTREATARDSVSLVSWQTSATQIRTAATQRSRLTITPRSFVTVRSKTGRQAGTGPHPAHGHAGKRALLGSRRKGSLEGHEGLAAKGQNSLIRWPRLETALVGGSAARQASSPCPSGWFWPACSFAQPHCESPGQARWGSRHGSDLPLRTRSATHTRALSLSLSRPLLSTHPLPHGWRLGRGGGSHASQGQPQYPVKMSPTASTCTVLYLVTTYLAVFSKTFAPPLGQADHTPPPLPQLGRLPSTCAPKCSFFAFVHIRTPFSLPGPIAFPSPSLPMLAPSRALILPTCPFIHPPCHPACHSSLLPICTGQWPPSRFPLIHPASLQPHPPFCTPAYFCVTAINLLYATLHYNTYGSGLYSFANPLHVFV